MSIEMNINRKVAAVTEQVMQVLLDVGGAIEARAVAYAPADTGNLRGSSATVREGNTVTVAFAAEYAAAVHEMVPKHAGEKRTTGTKKGSYWDSGKPHFLKDAVDELQPALEAALKEVKV